MGFIDSVLMPRLQDGALYSLATGIDVNSAVTMV